MPGEPCHLSLRAGSLKHRSPWLASWIFSGITIACVKLTSVTTSRFEEVLAAMGAPFTVLTVSVYRTAPDVPDSFLCGSAPRLRLLHLDCIHFRMGTFHLKLGDGPCLSALTRLKELSLEFESPFPLLPNKVNIRQLTTHSVLPALTHFKFQVFSEYLGDLMAHTDALLYSSALIFWQLLCPVMSGHVSHRISLVLLP